MDDLKHWFNSGQLYDQGVQLYLKYGKDDNLRHLFTAEGISAFKEKRLAEELDTIYSRMKPAPRIPEPEPSTSYHAPRITEPEPRAPQPVTETRWPDNPDDVVKALKAKWQPLFSEMINLQSRIEDVAKSGLQDLNKKAEAGRMALRILELDDLCYDIYAERDYYLQNGALPSKQTAPVEISLDPTIWHRRLASHQRYVREDKAKLKKDPQNAKLAQRIQRNEWAVAEYKKLLKID